MTSTDGRTTIRGLDPKLFAEARAAALKKRQTIGDWINEAMTAKLKKQKGDK